jgi:ppGpp synthetase/RelA/SpoT-type nucleotidyltranferase
MTTRKNTKEKKEVENAPAKIFQAAWNKEEFLNHCEINEELLQKSKICWEELANIHDDHCAETKKLDTVAKYIADRLREVPQIHSVRVRIKNAKNLVRKVLRKRIEDASRDIRFENYRQEITDLIGIRALHLYKEDWLGIHGFVKEEWKIEETPIAYIREGDSSQLTKSYEESGCEVKLHPRKYRSVHYLVNCPLSKIPTVAEVQTRTLFEEAWSEIDHQINYPETVGDEVVAHYLELFNRYAGSADEMGSFLQILVANLQLQDLQSERIKAERDEALQKMEEAVNKSKMSETEKAELEEQLRKLRNTNTNLLQSNTRSDFKMALRRSTSLFPELQDTFGSLPNRCKSCFVPINKLGINSYGLNNNICLDCQKNTLGFTP